MLDISPILMLSSAIIFLVVLVILNSRLFRPLLNHMDMRSSQIKSDLEEAKSNSSDVDELLVEANEIISKAKREAASIREQAYKEAKDSADVKLASERLNLDTKVAEFKNSLQDEAKALKSSLLSSMPQFNDSLKNKLNSI
ncbi:F0F1 ATP synthase subunit B family protein [Arcobacter porcinus]|uniref:ATP synthase subunit b n=1 Tax=Arcobacter porcinus TaxID=1935204 RepID=A0ABX2YE04_9BACT|nr:F0F1 ATP synthase subunit B' [Arcobacter porcinus]OCL83627.1 F0F1 ATP synthase subunit B' [Arcobacter porcinus]OCL83846.1 F0F1 ATP synthase subunit B' [Arcobacter porcinus]OCL92839.1 F0F1 ATP synthase subunit B' [Arcobacter porcinus]